MPNQQSNNSQMQLQNQSLSIQNNPLTNLQKFLNNYNKFIEENITIELNSETILNDIALNILQPPTGISQQHEQLYSLFLNGKQLPEILSKDSHDVQEMLARLKKLKQDKIYETILFIEQLNYKLNKDYEIEVNRGIENGVYNRKNLSQTTGDAMIGTNKGLATVQSTRINSSLEKIQKSLK